MAEAPEPESVHAAEPAAIAKDAGEAVPEPTGTRLSWALRTDGETHELQGPLDVAIRRQGVADVKALVLKGAPLSAIFHLDDLGKDTGNALDLAMLHKRYDLAIQLLKFGEEQGAQIARECSRALAWAARDGKAQVLQALLERGTDPAQGDERSRSALQLAALRGHAQCVNILLDAGAFDVETCQDDVLRWIAHWKMQTPLGAELPLAEQSPSSQSPRAPASAQAPSSVAGTTGTEAGAVAVNPDLQYFLDLAIKQKGIKEVDSLVQRGAPVHAAYDLNELGTEVGNVLDLALQHRRYELALQLVSRGELQGGELAVTCVRAVSWSARDGREQILKELLQRKASVDQRDEQDRSALHLAALRGHAKCVRALIACGAWRREPQKEEVIALTHQWQIPEELPPPPEAIDKEFRLVLWP